MSSSTTNSCITKGTGCSSPTNLPEFIDTSACLCGLVKSASSLPDNGQQIQYWRCIGDASADVTHGGNGKWYNTSLPSQELSAIAQPQNWKDNPPNTTVAYVLVNTNGQASYQPLGSGGSPELIGADSGCTGKNDTTLSGTFYSQGKGASKSRSSSSSSASSATSSKATSASRTASTTTAPSSAATATSTGSTSTTGTAAPQGTSSAAANHVSLRSIALVGMILAPLATFLL